MSTEGYPDSTTADSFGCLELWTNVMFTSINVVAFPGAVSTPEWSALRIGPACVHINHNGTALHSKTPFFSYFSTTVRVTGLILIKYSCNKLINLRFRLSVIKTV